MISRRTFIKTGGAAAAGFAVRPPFAQAFSVPREAPLPRPTTAQVAWQEAEIGALFHLDLPLFAGDYTRNNASRETFDPRLYNPAKLDTDQWVTAAKSAGARYAIFTATHFSGFMQWQSDLYPYGCKQAAWRDGTGDVVGDFVTSCRKFGIKPGLYFSTHRNVYHNVWGHFVDWGEGKGTPDQKAFNRIAERMTTELCSRYGELFQIWFDAGVKSPSDGGPDVLPIFEKFQPDSVFYHSTDRSDHRWIGNEAGHAAYPCWSTMPGPEVGPISHNSDTWRTYLHGGDPNGSYWSPGMVDVVLRGQGNHDWVWRPDQDHTVHTVDELMKMYDQSVGRNCNLVIGVVVDNKGLVPTADFKRLGEFGRALDRRFSKPVAETTGSGEIVELILRRPTRIDHVVIMEDIALGERTRAYSVETLTRGNRWLPLCDGFSLGHKRIQQFPATEVSRVRLRILQARATPKIKKFAVYSVS